MGWCCHCCLRRPAQAHLNTMLDACQGAPAAATQLEPPPPPEGALAWTLDYMTQPHGHWGTLKLHYQFTLIPKPSTPHNIMICRQQCHQQACMWVVHPRIRTPHTTHLHVAAEVDDL